MINIICEIDFDGLTEELDKHIKDLALKKGWTEQIESIDENEDIIMIDNPVQPLEIINKMVMDYLKEELRTIILQQAQDIAREQAIEVADIELDRFSSELVIN